MRSFPSFFTVAHARAEAHGIPPPLFWMQNPCFHEVTDRVALQNIENKEVPCKIFLDKELRDVSASASSFRLKDGVPDDDLQEDFWDDCATKNGINLQGLAVQAAALRAMGFVVTQVPKSEGSPPHGRRPVRGDPEPGAPGITRMSIHKTPTSYFASASPATTAATLSSIWFQPSS